MRKCFEEIETKEIVLITTVLTNEVSNLLLFFIRPSKIKVFIFYRSNRVTVSNKSYIFQCFVRLKEYNTNAPIKKMRWFESLTSCLHIFVFP